MPKFFKCCYVLVQDFFAVVYLEVCLRFFAVAYLKAGMCHTVIWDVQYAFIYVLNTIRSVTYKYAV